MLLALKCVRKKNIVHHLPLYFLSKCEATNASPVRWWKYKFCSMTWRCKVFLVVFSLFFFFLPLFLPVLERAISNCCTCCWGPLKWTCTWCVISKALKATERLSRGRNVLVWANYIYTCEWMCGLLWGTGAMMPLSQSGSFCFVRLSNW